jgi:hypothetical protein
MRALFSIVWLAGGVIAASSCSRDLAPTRLFESDAETWTISDREFRLLGTHYERGKGSDVLYVMTYPLPSLAARTELTAAEAASQALPLIPSPVRC